MRGEADETYLNADTLIISNYPLLLGGEGRVR